jgi:hypothetical protein
MSDIENNENLDAELQQASEKLHLDLDWMRSITPEDLQYLLDHCPFLQIIDTEAHVEPPAPMEFIRAVSGWDIHNYGDAMSSSPGRFIFGGGDFRIFLEDDDDGSGGKILNPGKGTIYKQAIDTAMQMVELAQLHHWQGIQIIDGHSLMKRAAWIKASQLGMSLTGFTPTERDKKIRGRLELSQDEIEFIREQIKKPGPG